MRFKDVFSIIGPAMVGPSSSHTAGAARIGRAARQLYGRDRLPARAEILLYGSFADTYKGHGTDMAIVGGLLDFATDDDRIPRALELARLSGMEVAFIPGKGLHPHPNTAKIVLYPPLEEREAAAGSPAGDSAPAAPASVEAGARPEPAEGSGGGIAGMAGGSAATGGDEAGGAAGGARAGSGGTAGGTRGDTGGDPRGERSAPAAGEQAPVGGEQAPAAGKQALAGGEQAPVGGERVPAARGDAAEGGRVPGLVRATVPPLQRAATQPALVMMGTSIGGGNIEIVGVNGFNVRFSGVYPALVITHTDSPGVIADITQILKREWVNIGYMSVDRKSRAGDAMMVLELDSTIPPTLIEELAGFPSIREIRTVELS